LWKFNVITAAGQALTECGESYRQLAEVKYSLEDSVRQNFIEPLLHLQSKDLREVNVCNLLVTLCSFAACLILLALGCCFIYASFLFCCCSFCLQSTICQH